MIELDRRTERRLLNSLDRLSDIDCLLEDLTRSGTGRLMKELTDEYLSIKDDIRMYDIPVGTVLSSRDGAMTLGRFAGPRVLDSGRYHNSGVSYYLCKEHPGILVPESPSAAEEVLGESISGYYTSKPVTRVTERAMTRAPLSSTVTAREEHIPRTRTVIGLPLRIGFSIVSLSFASIAYSSIILCSPSAQSSQQLMSSTAFALK